MVNLALLPEEHTLQEMSEREVALESGTTFMSIADNDDEDRVGIEKSLLGQAPPSVNLEHNVLQKARRDLGAIYRAVQRQAVYGEVPVLPQGIPDNAQHLMHDMRDFWKNQGKRKILLEH